MSDQPSSDPALHAILTRLEVAIATLRREQVETRLTLMQRIDRLQERTEFVFEDIRVTWYNTDRVERRIVRQGDEVEGLRDMVKTLTVGLRRLESRIAALEDKSAPPV